MGRSGERRYFHKAVEMRGIEGYFRKVPTLWRA